MALLKENARFCYLFIIDALALLAVISLQGAFLDYLLVKHSETEEFIRLAIFAGLDLMVCAIVIRTFVVAYRFFGAKHQDFPDSGKQLKPKWYQRGVLPLSYFSWFFYIVVLLAKLLLICARLDVSKENPQVLQVCLAVSTIVFFLIVENHNWARKSSESYSFTSGVCKKNGIEIFDSVEMLELLLTPGKLSLTVKCVLFFLASFNFMLPTLSLYRLSLSEFGTKRTPSCFPLKVLHNVLRFTFVDLPFFVIRLHTWISQGDLSIFMMKNFFNILMALRELYLDVCIYFKSKKKGGSDDEMEKRSLHENEYENIPLNDGSATKTNNVETSTTV